MPQEATSTQQALNNKADKATTLQGYGITDAISSNTQQTAKTVLIAPNGADGSPTFRLLQASDIPTLNQNTTGNATTATTLQTSRTINGVSFNGSANITVGVSGNDITWTTSATAGKFDTSTTNPTSTNRLNYGGYIYPTALNLVGQGDTTTSPSHIFVETESDGFVRPQTLAQFKTNLFADTTAIGDATATTKSTGDNTTAVATTAYANAIAGGTTVPAKSLASNGYVKMANGLIIQWMNVTESASATDYKTFPIAFPTTCLTATLQLNSATSGGLGQNVGTILEIKDKTKFIWSAGGTLGVGGVAYIIAIGY